MPYTKKVSLPAWMYPRNDIKHPRNIEETGAKEIVKTCKKEIGLNFPEACFPTQSNPQSADTFKAIQTWVASYKNLYIKNENANFGLDHLQQAYADQRMEDFYGNTILNIIAFSGDEEILAELLKQNKLFISTKNVNGENMLHTLVMGYHAATEAGMTGDSHINWIKEIVKKQHGDLSTFFPEIEKDAFGDTPFMLAVRLGAVALINKVHGSPYFEDDDLIFMSIHPKTYTILSVAEREELLPIILPKKEPKLESKSTQAPSLNAFFKIPQAVSTPPATEVEAPKVEFDGSLKRGLN